MLRRSHDFAYKSHELLLKVPELLVASTHTDTMHCIM